MRRILFALQGAGVLPGQDVQRLALNPACSTACSFIADAVVTVARLPATRAHGHHRGHDHQRPDPQLIIARASTREMGKNCGRSGMKTLRMVGLDRAREGVSTLEQVLVITSAH